MKNLIYLPIAAMFIACAPDVAEKKLADNNIDSIPALHLLINQKPSNKFISMQNNDNLEWWELSIAFRYFNHPLKFTLFNYIMTTHIGGYYLDGGNSISYEIKYGANNMILSTHSGWQEISYGGEYDKQQNTIISQRKAILIPPNEYDILTQKLNDIDIFNINSQSAMHTSLFHLRMRLSNIDTTYTIGQTDKETIQKCQALQQLITNEISTTK